MNDDLDDRPSEGSDPVAEDIRMLDPKRRFARSLLVALVLLLGGAGVGATINYYDLTLPWHHDDTEAYPPCHAVPTMAGSIDPAFEILCLTDDGYVRLYRTATTTTTRPTTTTTTLPYLQLRVAEADFADDLVQREGLSHAERQTESNQEWLAGLVEVGWQVCETLDNNPYSQQRTLREWTTVDGQVSYRSVRFVASAIEHLCPQHADLLG